MLGDTSVWVGLEAGRIDILDLVEYAWAVSAITVGELRLGVLRATNPVIASIRLTTYEVALQFDPLPINEQVCETWAAMVAALRAAGRRMPLNDSWIAATALAHGVPVATQDADYDDVPGLSVIKF